jgi:hypothetical protein
MFSFGSLTSFLKKWWLPLLFCVVLPTAVVGSVIQRHSQFSPIDEQAHFDYVERLYSHGVPVLGDPLMESTLKEIACRGTALPGIVTPPCDSPNFTAKDFPGEGFQYEAQQPPLYYAIAAPVAKVMEKVVGLGPVGSARITGLLLLIAGLLLSWHVAMMMKISRLTSVAGIAVMGLSPAVVYYSAMVTNDSAGILCGALVCYVAALAHIKQRPYVKHAIAVGVVCALTKGFSVVPAVIFGVVFILLSLYHSGGFAALKSKQSIKQWWHSASAKIYAHTGIALIVSSVIVTAIWTTYVGMKASISPPTLPTFAVLRSDTTNLGSLLQQGTNMFIPLTGKFHPFTVWNYEVFELLNSVAVCAVIAGCSAGIFVQKHQWWSVLGPLVLAGMYAGGLVEIAGFWRVYNLITPTEPRFALPMVPILVLILCAGIQRATAQKVFALGAFAFSAMSVWIIIQTPLV